MNLAIWLPATFAWGLVGLGLCFTFLVACEKVQGDSRFYLSPTMSIMQHNSSREKE